MIGRLSQPDTDADRELRDGLDHSPPASFIMVAGAGSGKTTSLVKALAHIGKKHGPKLRKGGQKIACITYMEIAAQEIFLDVGNDPLFHVSTIHSFLWTLVKPFQSEIHSWVTRRIEEKLRDLREKASTFGPRVHQRTRDKNLEDTIKYEEQMAQMPHVSTFIYSTGSDYPEGILGHDDIIKMVPALICERPLMRTLLARRYPFVFVDESQDTIPVFVGALKAVDTQMLDQFCLGFFGDPMQKIYATGVGEIPLEVGWRRITKPENFRCPTGVLSVINRIRAGSDGLVQTMGRYEERDGTRIPVQGSARVFIVPADEHRGERLKGIREWLAKENQDPLWLRDDKDANVRVLVIVHRMAAKRLGFPELYSALNDDAPSSLSEGFSDGTLWALQPFISFLLPLIQADEEDRQFEVMNLLRTFCPLLSDERLSSKPTAEVLKSLKQLVRELRARLAPNSRAKVLDVLRFVRDSKLGRFDERLGDYLADFSSTRESSSPKMTAPEDGEDSSRERNAIAAYFDCPANQLWGYLTYIRDESPFWTQQGVKGAEYDRVLTVIDDEEGPHPQFSYNKYFGLTPPSATDKKNREEGKDTVIDRTRRLFYVCCSRALRDLAVVFFTGDVRAAEAKIRTAAIFETDQIHVMTEPPAAAGIAGS
jgi:DNA helicase-2/ATP-dependent DNA helicase PcrA